LGETRRASTRAGSMRGRLAAPQPSTETPCSWVSGRLLAPPTHGLPDNPRSPNGTCPLRRLPVDEQIHPRPLRPRLTAQCTAAPHAVPGRLSAADGYGPSPTRWPAQSRPRCLPATAASPLTSASKSSFLAATSRVSFSTASPSSFILPSSCRLHTGTARPTQTLRGGTCGRPPGARAAPNNGPRRRDRRGPCCRPRARFRAHAGARPRPQACAKPRQRGAAPLMQRPPVVVHRAAVLLLGLLRRCPLLQLLLVPAHSQPELVQALAAADDALRLAQAAAGAVDGRREEQRMGGGAAARGRAMSPHGGRTSDAAPAAAVYPAPSLRQGR
jgi:hypothetical protein